MKAKKRGTLLKKERTETHIVTCPKCNVRLKLIPKDVHSDITRVFPRYYFKCKCCGQWTRIKLKEMPQTFKDEVIALNIPM